MASFIILHKKKKKKGFVNIDELGLMTLIKNLHFNHK